ncbi:hypothetical protein GW17_00013696 [Ensete ventricosum]|nr:hypothetical protein GW17_00013696 [Ensete ventricosum]
MTDKICTCIGIKDQAHHSTFRDTFFVKVIFQQKLNSLPYDIYHQINMLWPGLLGKDKYEFAKSYCSVKLVQRSHGVVFKVKIANLATRYGRYILVRPLVDIRTVGYCALPPISVVSVLLPLEIGR